MQTFGIQKSEYRGGKSGPFYEIFTAISSWREYKMLQYNAIQVWPSPPPPKKTPCICFSSLATRDFGVCVFYFLLFSVCAQCLPLSWTNNPRIAITVWIWKLSEPLEKKKKEIVGGATPTYLSPQVTDSDIVFVLSPPSLSCSLALYFRKIRENMNSF